MNHEKYKMEGNKAYLVYLPIETHALAKRCCLLDHRNLRNYIIRAINERNDYIAREVLGVKLHVD